VFHSLRVTEPVLAHNGVGFKQLMNRTSGALALLMTVAWFAAAAFNVFTFFRHRRYIASLPPSAGNRKMKRQHRIFLVVGLAMLALGAWNLFATLLR
jgi:hypothetical protein